MLQQARGEALKRMQDNAKQWAKNSNGVRLSTSTISGVVAEIFEYGTAVKLK